MRMLLPLAAATLACAPVPASAEIPDPVRAMIDAAIATGDASKVATVIDLAKATNPDAVEEIEALRTEFAARQAKLAEERKIREQQAMAEAGVFELWKGRAEVGGVRTTGNTDTLGLTGAISLDRKGVDWQHRVALRADLQRSGGRVTREKYFASYEPRYEFREDLFAYGLAQFERDRFQGFDARYALSGGVGYTVFDTPDLDLSLKAGPALRISETTDGLSDTRLAGLFGLDLAWRITERLKLTQATNAVTETGGAALVLVDSRSTTVNLVTGLEAKVSDRLSTRFSYAVDYDSNPPAGKVTTDSISRFSLVYGF